MLSSTGKPSSNYRQRINIWYAGLIFILIIFIARLFYLQIVRHDYYRQQALNDQLKEYSIAAPRGIIEAKNGDSTLPLVLNETLYTLYVDPTLVKNAPEVAIKLTNVTGGDKQKYQKLIGTPNSRYVILAKRLNEDQKNKIITFRLPGVGTQTQNYRSYPQGSLAAQLLGFVNNDGKGVYGLEQAMNAQLSGKPGKLKAITDAAGVPLVASKENIQIDPRPGKKVVLTIDLAMQKQLENLLKQGLDKAGSKSGSALIMDPNNGAVKAMANWPTYNPAEYYKVDDPSVFNNAAVTAPLEVGSIMKVLTAAAALDQGVIKPDTSYYDPSRWDLDDHTITNIEEDGGAGTHNIASVLNLSINTGATWMLMQMGGQTGQVNLTARQKWHDYMVNHYMLGKPTGIEQGYEAGGYIPDPVKGYGLQLAYANTSFGQAMTATPLQMGAALSAVLNGGNYFKPHLVEQTVDGLGKKTIVKPEVKNAHVVSSKISPQIQSLMEYVVDNHHLNPPFSKIYSVGGKTGTAQIANPTGGYFANKYNGTYLGFVGGDKPQYIIVVRVNNPSVGGYAGTAAAQPIFTSIGHMLINSFNILPKTSP